MNASIDRLTDLDALSTQELLAHAQKLRDGGKGRQVSYSPKIFIPLTRLCRDRCGYCVYRRRTGGSSRGPRGPRAESPRTGGRANEELRQAHPKAPFMELDEVLGLARRGAEAGCREALFVLGERPEEAYPEAAQWLKHRGYGSAIDYLEAACGAVLARTGLLPHSNAGTLDRNQMKRLADVNVSLGLMLESTSPRLVQPGAAHAQAPSKDPALRLAQLQQAGRLGIPFTTGILVGIGESPRERLQSLLAIRGLSERHGHIQETIVQNFRRKPGTPMAASPEPDHVEMMRTIAQARIILGPDANLQAPPNLAHYESKRPARDQDPPETGSPTGKNGRPPGRSSRKTAPCLANPQGGQDSKAHLDYLEAGINDYGGLSPLTFDWVNPEAPWPHLEILAADLKMRGYRLRPRLAVYPEYLRGKWLSPGMQAAAQARADSDGYCPESASNPALTRANLANSRDLGRLLTRASKRVRRTLQRALAGQDITCDGLSGLLQAAGPDHQALLAAADHLRRRQCGEEVSYVVNRNINFTNVCVKGCRFCAFSRGFRNRQGYWLPTEEIVRRARQAAEFGCTEICLQAGLPPDMPGDFYIRLCETLKTALPDVHIHAFSPEEVLYGSQRSGRTVRQYLADLKAAGAGSLPGTSAEILVQDVRERLAPGRIRVEEWIEIITTAHELEIPTTSTIMYGHIETPGQAARHLLLLRSLQRRTGGFSEFVPLSFVAQEAPMVRRGLIPESRRGATQREVFNMHAAARLALGRDIPNIQASWVKEGFQRARELLSAGANDLGGTLINESISTSAGAPHGQLATPARLRRLIRQAGRIPVQRSTLYQRLARFPDPADDPQDPLDCLGSEATTRFGSYQTLTQDARFPFPID